MFAAFVERLAKQRSAVLARQHIEKNQDSWRFLGQSMDPAHGWMDSLQQCIE
jgi:hypothetical protein